ncbi:unnamed protein product [Ambrosiozyma monospora]|uniref:Unnamed protein product n=1 Tax=Ambrosiozyma monospora TaxID=43982 RepID=A0ACB5SUT8_AMBMO|nr:unnamed protein product [Ambrosiozyma monospora]
MGISEFEKQRQANISRNQELFKKLNLDAISRDFSKEIESESKKRSASGTNKKSGPAKKKRVTKIVWPTQPTRRSRRLAGVKVTEAEAKGIDNDPTLGSNGNPISVKDQPDAEFLETKLSANLSVNDILGDDPEELEKFTRLRNRFSVGDFYDEMKKLNKTATGNGKVDRTRDELENLQLYEPFAPNDIHLTSDRINNIIFHPSNTKKIIIAGDTLGEMGIWSVEDDDDEKASPEIAHFKFHKKNIPKFEIRSEKPEEVITASYDGTIRQFDLTKGVSKTVLEFDDEWGSSCGITDIKFIDTNICYLITMEGEFSSFDIREKTNWKRSGLEVLRLHDKKSGMFSVNPNNISQIATGSNDRTLRIWDLRTVGVSTWSAYEDAKSPHCIGSYRSRLSVSSADWNRSNDIVCNGYDNTIRIFQLGKQIKGRKPVIEPILGEEEWEGIPNNLEPHNTLVHNCQTGKWVSILKSRWHANPSDGVEKFVIGNMNHSLDVFDRNGDMLAHLNDVLMTATPAACNFHPTENWLVGANARGRPYLFLPSSDSSDIKEENEEQDEVDIKEEDSSAVKKEED